MILNLNHNRYPLHIQSSFILYIHAYIHTAYIFIHLQVECAGVIEIANLSLDESEMEAVFFTQDDHFNENAE